MRREPHLVSVDDALLRVHASTVIVVVRTKLRDLALCRGRAAVTFSTPATGGRNMVQHRTGLSRLNGVVDNWVRRRAVGERLDDELVGYATHLQNVDAI